MNQRTFTSRCQRPGWNPRQASLVLVSFFGAGAGAALGSATVELMACLQKLFQQRTRFAARPASLVSLYFAPMSLPVWARVLIVVSRSTRCRDAISLVATMKATQAFTAPNAQRSMHGTCT